VYVFWLLFRSLFVIFQERYFETVQPKQSNGKKTGITSVVAGSHQSAKVIFDDSRVAEFKYVWLRDNCKCSECFHGATKQKLIDSPSIDVNIQPRSLEITGDGKLVVNWPEGNGTHQTVHDAEWYLFIFSFSYIGNYSVLLSA